MYPWPPTTGSRQRVAALIAAAAEAGEVDVFAWVDQRRPDLPLPAPEAGPDRLVVAVRLPVRASPARRLTWLLGGRLPLRVALRENTAARRSLRDFRRPPYDAAVIEGAEAGAVFGDLVPEPTLVDLNDLEDARVESRGAVDRGVGGTPLRSWVTAFQSGRDRRAWTILQERLAEAAGAVSVCSELDRARLGWPGAVVVPNGYEAPLAPAGNQLRHAGQPPTVSFVGSLTYPPNVDAARWLVQGVGPRLSHLVPGVQLRLVGRPGAEVSALADPPGVVVTGFVERVDDELARADVIVVPVRHGSGTRIKVLEAFAHRLPVVSTTLGAEGIEAENERHLLLADTPQDFAEACARVLQDGPLGARLVDEAHQLFLERYQWRAVRGQVRDVLKGLSDGTRPATEAGGAG